MKQIGLALHNYHDTHTVFPPESIWAAGTQGNYSPRNYSWLVMLLPFLDQTPLYNQIDFQAPLWNQTTADGQLITAQQLDVLTCPSDSAFGGPGVTNNIAWTNYIGSEGWDWWPRSNSPLGGMFTLLGKRKMRDITDGTSTTIIVSEVLGHGSWQGAWDQAGSGERIPNRTDAVMRAAFLSPPFADPHTDAFQFPAPDGSTVTTYDFWTKSLDPNGPGAYKPTYIAIAGPNSEWHGPSSLHEGGLHVLLGDGAVRFLSENIHHTNDPTTSLWQHLNSVNGGEVISGF